MILITRENGDNSNNFVDSKKTMNKREFEEQENININILEDANYELIILPENRIFGEPSEEENRFLSTTKEILTILSENGVKTSLYDDGRKKTEIRLHSAPIDVVLPYMYMLADSTKDLIISIIAAWIYEKFITPRQKQDEFNITINLAFPNDDDNIDIKQLKGSPEQVYESLEKVRHNQNQLSLENPVKPMTSYKESRIQIAKEYFSKAKDDIHEAFRKILEEDEIGAKKLFISALNSLRQAYLNDSKDKYEKELLRIGRFVHDHFGCELKVRDDGICDIDCPVLLSDVRRGVSIGATATAICSIFGENIFNCPHLPGRTYNAVVCNKEHICNICKQKNCDHEVGKRYNDVEAMAFLTEMNGDHLAFVENPLDPSTAITNMPKHVDQLLSEVPVAERSKFYNPRSNSLKCHFCAHPT